MLSGLNYPAWFIVPGFVYLSGKKEDPFLCFHAIQSVLMGVFSVMVLTIVTLMVWVLFHVLPQSGGFFAGMFGVVLFSSIFLAGSAIFLANIFMGWQASSGRFFKLPIIGDFAEAKMVEHLDLDYEAVKKLSDPRQLAPEPGAVFLEPIPFPGGADSLSDKLRDPEVVQRLAQVRNQSSSGTGVNRPAESASSNPFRTQQMRVSNIEKAAAPPAPRPVRPGDDRTTRPLPAASSAPLQGGNKGSLPSAFRSRETRIVEEQPNSNPSPGVNGSRFRRSSE